MFRRTKIKMAADFWWEIIQDRRQWSDIFKVLNGKKKPSILATENIFKKYKHETKALTAI